LNAIKTNFFSKSATAIYLLIKITESRNGLYEVILKYKDEIISQKQESQLSENQ
jgi:hypothetical protein